MRAIVIVALCGGLAVHAGGASAQTWSAARPRPPLWQISSVDATGEQGWPYGREDIAGDGLATFEDDEAAADLRTVYADADADRSWLRAYVAAGSEPPEEVVVFFFLDADGRDETGGAAAGAALWPEWESDPSAGGYERAVGVRGDGTSLGAFRWNDDAWSELTPSQDDVRIERGVDRDPIRIGTLEHGYVQVALAHRSFGLDQSCDGNVFVRVWHDGTGRRSFGDDDDGAAACRVPSDPLGDPVVLRRGECSSDAECPGDGQCRDGVCVFGYECGGDADCRTGERCSSGVCVRPTGAACTTDGDCDGLVCDGGRCAACMPSGARACEGERLCAPNGACFDPRGATEGQVQGGAFSCSASLPGSAAHWSTWLVLTAVALLAGLRRRGRQP